MRGVPLINQAYHVAELPHEFYVCFSRIFCDIFTRCIRAVNDMLYRDAPYCSFPHCRSPPSSPCSNWSPSPPCHARGEGEGPPPHKPLATSQPPMIGNPMCRLKWFYHPYTLTPQNDRLDVENSEEHLRLLRLCPFCTVGRVLSSSSTSLSKNAAELLRGCYSLI